MPPDNSIFSQSLTFDACDASDFVRQSSRSYASNTSVYTNNLNEQFNNQFKVHHIMNRGKKKELANAIYELENKKDTLREDLEN